MSVLEIAESYLRHTIAPRALEIESNPDALFDALQGLGKLELLALRVSRQWGGKEVSEETFGYFQELVARYSGALAFLQTQHQSAGGILFASGNASLQEKYLPRMGSGKVLLGIGFSQLRREGEPLTVATPVAGGYLLDGDVPWVTGWGMFQEFIVTAVLPDGSAVFGIVPFQECNACDRVDETLSGSISFSQPADLAAMASTNTVTATLTRWFLPEDRVVFIKPPGWIQENDKKNVLKATFLATGCAWAGLDILEATDEKKSLYFIKDTLLSLKQELNNCRRAIEKAQQSPGVELGEKLRLRGWAIDLATRVAHAAVTVSSGAANYKHHNAQRVYREALVFTVTGQTTAVMEATLQQLVRPRLSYSRVIHLSHVIDIDIPRWQEDPPVEFETVAQIDTHGYYLRRFSIGEHSATHINAPNSFYPNGVGIDAYPADSLVVPAVVIDIRDRTQKNPDYALTVDDVLAWEEKHGRIPRVNLVLLYTGWQDKWSDRSQFMNQDEEGNMHFPGFGGDATKFLLDEREIAGVGIDTHGVDPGLDTTFTTNRLVLEKQGIVLENLTNLDLLPSGGITVAIGVMRLRGGSGSTVGVLALV